MTFESAYQDYYTKDEISKMNEDELERLTIRN